MYPNNVPLEERVMFHEEILAVDTGVQATLSYHGPQASGLIQIAASTSIMTFQHGALGAEIDDDDPKLDPTGNAIIDPNTDISDWHSLQVKVNASDNWHLALKGARPDLDPNTTTTGYIITQVDGDCVVTSTSDGFDMLNDNSGSEGHGIGMTFDGPVSKVHGTDHGVLHVITRIDVDVTYGSGAVLLNAYACDDDDGGVELVRSWTPGSTGSQVVYPAEANAMTFETFTKGKRLVLDSRNVTADQTSPAIKVTGWSYAYGPALRKSKLWSQY